MISRFFIRDFGAQDYLENFIISAVVTILAIRLYLFLTGYPQVGGGGLHIAHMLWGGLLMLVAMVIALMFSSRMSKQVVAIIGGIGFGTFIDELGKFVTSDNNYFFQPTVALLYLIFVIIYLVGRYLYSSAKYSSDEYLINSLEVIKEAIVKEMDQIEKERALDYLKLSHKNEQLRESLTAAIEHLKPIAPSTPHLWTRLELRTSAIYQKLLHSHRLTKVFVILFIVASFFSFFDLLDFDQYLSIAEWGQLISSVVASGFVLVGVFWWRKSRIRAYQLFEVAVLISLLITQFFIFYQVQFWALIGFSIDLFLLSVFRYSLKQELSTKDPAAI